MQRGRQFGEPKEGEHNVGNDAVQTHGAELRHGQEVPNAQQQNSLYRRLDGCERKTYPNHRRSLFVAGQLSFVFKKNLKGRCREKDVKDLYRVQQRGRSGCKEVKEMK